MISWLMRKPLWMHMLLGLSVVILVFFAWLSSLDWFTNHGNSTEVPTLVGKSYEEARTILKKAGFEVEILDSIYTDTIPPLHVMSQSPEPLEIVKSGRLVYLTVSRVVPPEVEMPSLVGQSYRNAEMILKSLDLRVGDTTYRIDFARNSVLEQWYQGAPIKAGASIRKGASIDFVLGNGVGDKEMLVPSLMGLKYSDAKLILDQMGLGLGVLVLESGFSDTLNGYIIRQEPTPRLGDSITNRIRSGQLMDLWLGVQPLPTDSL